MITYFLTTEISLFVVAFLREYDGEHSMGSTTRLIHVGGSYGSVTKQRLP